MRSVNELFRLDGRVALITGAAGHVGLACCEALAEGGAQLALVDRDIAACETRASDLVRRFGIRAVSFETDLLSPASADVVDRVATVFGGIDILIHIAAYTGTTNRSGFAATFANQTIDAWDEAIRVNLTAAFALSQRAMPLLQDHEHSGAVIFVGSIYGSVGPQWDLYNNTAMTNPVAYGASKGGLLQLARYLATILAPKVRVNCISPGGIARGQDPQFIQRYEERTPLKRMGVEEDLKGAFAYLASDASSYVTGQNLLVDGGWTAW